MHAHPRTLYPLTLVNHEVNRAEQKFGPFNSTHEGLGVLLEEFNELVDAIQRNDAAAVQREATQVSAVALRIVACCGMEEFCRRSGFNPEARHQS